MILYGRDAEIAGWMFRQLKLRPYPDGSYVAVGIVGNGKFLGGVLWHNYHEDSYGKPLLIEVSIATVDKRWATRHNLRELFQYPYRQLGVKRVQATVHRKARRVRASLKKLGFSFEGIVREAHPLGGDAAHYSMLESECFWIGDKSGEIDAECARSTRPNDYSAGSNSQQSANRAL